MIFTPYRSYLHHEVSQEFFNLDIAYLVKKKLVECQTTLNLE